MTEGKPLAASERLQVELAARGPTYGVDEAERLALGRPGGVAVDHVGVVEGGVRVRRETVDARAVRGAQAGVLRHPLQPEGGRVE